MSADKFDFRIDDEGRLIWDSNAIGPNEPMLMNASPEFVTISHQRCRPATNPEMRMWKRLAELEARLDQYRDLVADRGRA